jgi:hypothetical protein
MCTTVVMPGVSDADVAPIDTDDICASLGQKMRKQALTTPNIKNS